MLEGPERLLTTWVVEGRETLITEGETVLEGPESRSNSIGVANYRSNNAEGKGCLTRGTALLEGTVRLLTKRAAVLKGPKRLLKAGTVLVELHGGGGGLLTVLSESGRL